MKSSYMLENEVLLDPFTIPEGALGGVWIVNPERINLHDLADGYRPGKIVRIRGPMEEAFRYVPVLWDDFARVAGMISDEA